MQRVFNYANWKTSQSYYIFLLCDLNDFCIKQPCIYSLSKWKCNNKLVWTLKVSESLLWKLFFVYAERNTRRELWKNIQVNSTWANCVTLNYQCVAGDWVEISNYRDYCHWPASTVQDSVCVQTYMAHSASQLCAILGSCVPQFLILNKESAVKMMQQIMLIRLFCSLNDNTGNINKIIRQCLLNRKRSSPTLMCLSGLRKIRILETGSFELN